VAEFLGAQAAAFAVLPPLLLVMAVTLMIILLTELTSNTATTATMVPVLAALAPGLGVNPSLLIVPCTIAASCAFMMPVATPPNAIVFGSGFITTGQMCKAGFLLNIAGITIITVIGYLIVLPMIRF
jgi:solute carrier family 13 (sodium-dependent dicarboxylate transporter), member 2/3/5